MDTSLRTLYKASAAASAVILLLSPVVLEAADAASSVAGFGLGGLLVKKAMSAATTAWQSRGRAVQSPLARRLLEAAVRARVVAHRLEVMREQARAMKMCLRADAFEAAAGIFAELLAFIHATIPLATLSALDEITKELDVSSSSSPSTSTSTSADNSRKRALTALYNIRAGYNAFFASEARLSELNDIVTRLNGAFSVVLSDFLIILSFTALRDKHPIVKSLADEVAEASQSCDFVDSEPVQFFGAKLAEASPSHESGLSAGHTLSQARKSKPQQKQTKLKGAQSSNTDKRTKAEKKKRSRSRSRSS